MPVTDFLVYVSIIFLPGIIWALSDRSLGNEKNPPAIVLVLKILLFGAVTYGVIITFRYLGWLPDISKFVQEAALILTGRDEKVPPEYELLILSLPISVILTLIWLYLLEIKAFNKFLAKIRVVKRTKLISFIEGALQCPPNCVLLIRIWDYKNDRSYKGKLRAFEESLDFIRLLLNEVEICDINGNILTNTEKFMYTCETKNFQFDIVSIKEKQCYK